MITDTVAYLRDQGRRVVLDAEHFFDGFRYDEDYAVACAVAAFEAGAETVVLCDTNGGMIPDWVTRSSRPCATAPEGGSACTPTTTAAARWPTPSRR